MLASQSFSNQGFMDYNPSDLENWSTDRLFELLAIIFGILKGRFINQRDSPEGGSHWSVLSEPSSARSAGRGSGTGVAAQAASSSGQRTAGYSRGSAGQRGRDIGPVAPFQCGFQCHFCGNECSRNKAFHQHHRCRTHRNW